MNPTSTGLNEHFVKHKTGLTQIIRVLTRDNGVLDWFLINKPKFFQPPLQLSNFGQSDQNVVLVKRNSPTMNAKAAKKTIMRHDLRESAIIAFGR